MKKELENSDFSKLLNSLSDERKECSVTISREEWIVTSEGIEFIFNEKGKCIKQSESN